MVVDRMLRAGVDPATAASLTGHSVVVMLRYYRLVTEVDREAAVTQAALASFPSADGPNATSSPASADGVDGLAAATGRVPRDAKSQRM
jgi:hypothetical protein